MKNNTLTLNNSDGLENNNDVKDNIIRTLFVEVDNLTADNIFLKESLSEQMDMVKLSTKIATLQQKLYDKNRVIKALKLECEKLKLEVNI